MLKIENLHVAVDDSEILKGLTLDVPAGEVHAIMGPNGSGKSTLSHTIAGRNAYDVTSGGVMLDGEDLLALDPNERAAKGLFLSFQHPMEIPGVADDDLYPHGASTLNAKRAGKMRVSAADFIKLDPREGKARWP